LFFPVGTIEKKMGEKPKRKKKIKETSALALRECISQPIYLKRAFSPWMKIER
jgi:hypothetical protein